LVSIVSRLVGPGLTVLGLALEAKNVMNHYQTLLSMGSTCALIPMLTALGFSDVRLRHDEPHSNIDEPRSNFACFFYKRERRVSVYEEAPGFRPGPRVFFYNGFKHGVTTLAEV